MPRLTRRQKGGMATRVHTTSMPANYDQPPGMFASNAAGVAGHGCPYNYYAQPGAAGRLSPAPYTTGQTGGTKCSNSAPTGFHVMGPNNGGSFDYGKCGSPERSLGMGAGKQAGGRRRKTRRGGKKFKKGTKSKTHRGKDFETRKSSKRYGEKRWRKYLRGRKTMIAPDFPFAGGNGGKMSKMTERQARRQTRRAASDQSNPLGKSPENLGLNPDVEPTAYGEVPPPGTSTVRLPASPRKQKRMRCFGEAPMARSMVIEWLKGTDADCRMKGGYRYSQKRKQGRRNKSKRVYRGGYHVPGSNVPNAPSYSTGGSLHGGLSALANPVPYQRLDNCIPNDFPIRH